MKKTKILFWVTTTFIFLFEGVVPALTSHTELAREGIRALGYPDYFGTLLTICKVLGALILIIPAIPARIKEWAYVGFGFDFMFAFASLAIVYGMSSMLILPAVCMIVLILSYRAYHKLNATVTLQ